MPTYAYTCNACGAGADVFQSIGAYTRAPNVPQCCGAPMVRTLTPAMLMMTNDAAYIGLRASDGTDISTRAKHRAYMRERGLTTMDDFSGQWQRDARERAERLKGNDPTRKADIVEAVRKLEAQHGNSN